MKQTQVFFSISAVFLLLTFFGRENINFNKIHEHAAAQRKHTVTRFDINVGFKSGTEKKSPVHKSTDELFSFTVTV